MINKTSPQISVIVVNYNGMAFIEKCLDPLTQDSLNDRIEIIVVDNGSKDGSPEFIKKKYPGICFLRNTENMGYAWANNRGIKTARGDYILLLNTDTVVEPKALFELLEILKSNERTGAVGPLLYFNKGKYQVSFGKKVDFFHEILQKSILNYFYKKRLKFLSRNKNVGWLSGACLMVKRNALIEAGFLDDNYFLYFEDIDLCYRLRQKEYKLIFTPFVRVYHKGGGSSAADSLKNRFHYRRSQLYFYRKHNSKLSLFILKIYLSIIFFLSFLKSWLGRESTVKEKMNFYRLLRSPGREDN